MPTRTFHTVLDELAAGAYSLAAQGHRFEQLVKAFLERDKAQAARFARVLHWADYPGNGGRHDTGIDLVTEERHTRRHAAIQCKFYAPQPRSSATMPTNCWAPTAPRSLTTASSFPPPTTARPTPRRPGRTGQAGAPLEAGSL